MRHRFFEAAFTGPVMAEQERHGSRATYARLTGIGSGTVVDGGLGADEVAFIAARDSFYLGTVSETGWPHVQHRGGSPGFVQVLGDRTLGWADFSGNRQYVSIGNVAANSRVAMFFMDYASRTRLKLLGRMTVFEIAERPDLDDRLRVAGYDARVEHAVLIEVEAFDWNCPQHIVQRYTRSQVEAVVEPLRREVTNLRAQLAEALAAR
jgi:hypothetical protein